MSDLDQSGTFDDMSTFLEVVELLLTNDEAKTAYGADPDGFLDEHGLGSFDSDDISDAMGHAADALPLAVATQLDPQSGLDSAAAVDLDSLGLSLEREPVEYDEIGPIDDTDPHTLDAEEFGDDVDFDTPDETPDMPATPDIDETVGEQTAEPIDTDTDDAAQLHDPAIDALDIDAELTELPVDQPEDPTMGIDDLDLPLGPDADHELDTDLTTDVPDDFDLLD